MKDRPFCVGLTGGVGCGKSTVSARFAKLGVKVIDADEIAHELTCTNGEAIAAIRDAFGNEYVSTDGVLNRNAMRVLVFSDPIARESLQAILHPLIYSGILQRIELQREINTSTYLLVVVPLLVENLAVYRSILDRIVVVNCDKQQQIARIATRSGLNMELAEAITAAQTCNSSRLAIADDLVDNRGDIDELDCQVKRLHELYLKQTQQ